MDDLAAVLARVPLFELLGREATEALADAGSTVDIGAGQAVCVEGDVGTEMYVVLDGELAVTKREADEEVAIATISDGEFFGEMSLLGAEARSATVVCVTDCRLFAVDRASFIDLVVSADNPGVALAIVSALANRVKAATERLAEERLAKRMLAAEIEADRLRSLARLVAGVAHELNTPLGVANTATGMVANRVGTDRFRALAEADADTARMVADIVEATDLAVRNLQRANRLIESFKKVSVDQVAAEVRSVSLRAAIADVLELFAIEAKRANLAVEVVDDLAPVDGDWVGDPGHLTQIVTNLLANVERHAYPPGQGGAVTITLGGDRTTRTLVVQDFGRGMEPETVDQIFTPFFTTARSAGGSGLGLAIVAGLVTDALGGTIAVDSTLGEGTTFRLVFPPVSPAGERQVRSTG